jgi:DNA processing protein
MGIRTESEPNRACAKCLRRSWLLAELSAVLDRNCRASGRLFELLALEDMELIAALGGRRRSELRRRHRRFQVRELGSIDGVRTICCHHEAYPSALRDPTAPRLLHVRGGLARLGKLTRGPLVTILGTTRASDYGMRMTRRLARELSASGVTIVAEWTAGIALAALDGALAVSGATISISGDGLGVPPAKGRADTYARLGPFSCTVSELPCHARGRMWGVAAGARIAAALGAVTVIVEAEDRERDLRGASIARELGRPVAALPGQLDSRHSTGAHVLLREGARLVRDAADVLDLMYGVDRLPPAPQPPSDEPSGSAPGGLARELREVLEQVIAGLDTPGKLVAGGRGGDPGALLHALSQLELLGLLGRGAGGRYVVRQAHRQRAPALGLGGQMES